MRRLAKTTERRWRTGVGCAVVLLTATTIGCGDGSTASLSGKVTIDGDPIPSDAVAVIGFTPDADAGAETLTAPIDAGRYSISGVPTGAVNATFRIVRPDGPMRTSDRTGKQYQEEINLVPAEHQAGVRINVSSGQSTHNFDL